MAERWQIIELYMDVQVADGMIDTSMSGNLSQISVEEY